MLLLFVYTENANRKSGEGDGEDDCIINVVVVAIVVDDDDVFVAAVTEGDVDDIVDDNVGVVEDDDVEHTTSQFVSKHTVAIIIRTRQLMS